MSLINTRSILDKIFHKKSIEDDTANMLVSSGDWVEMDSEYGILLRHKDMYSTLFWDNDGTPSKSFVLKGKNNIVLIKINLAFGQELDYYNSNAKAVEVAIKSLSL